TWLTFANFHPIIFGRSIDICTQVQYNKDEKPFLTFSRVPNINMSRPTTFRSVSSLTARPLSWLWPGRLALGKLAMLDGDPGLGKSLVSLDLCARLSTGRPFPDGQTSPGPASAIVLNGEDGPEDTIQPRLQALGADLDRVFVPPCAGDESVLRFPGHIGILDE